MTKIKFARMQLSASACLSALLGLSGLLLPIQNVQASCGPGLGAVTTITKDAAGAIPLTVTHIGDTVFIYTVEAGNLGSSYASSNIDVYLLLPNGTTNHVATNVRLQAGLSCVSAANGGGAANFGCGPGGAGATFGAALGNCLAFPTTYLVSANDLGRCLSFSITKGNLTTSVGPVCPAAHAIEFLEVAAGNAVQTDGTIFTGGNAQAAPNQEIPVIFPCITITKLCDLACTPYGQAICFHGTVTNSGDVALRNVVVTDSPPAGSTAGAITFDAVRPSGRTFDGTLGVGESVVYHGDRKSTRLNSSHVSESRM